MITKEKFLSYEKVRKSGKTNMFIVSSVQSLSEIYLTREEILEIMKNYDKLSEEYLK